MSSLDVLPLRVRRSLTALGRGLNVARRRRRLTAAMMAERIGVTRQTYARIEKGDASVAMGSYLMAMFVLGLEWDAFALRTDPQADAIGTSLEVAALPQRVRTPRTPQPK